MSTIQIRCPITYRSIEDRVCGVEIIEMIQSIHALIACCFQVKFALRNPELAKPLRHGWCSAGQRVIMEAGLESKYFSKHCSLKALFSPTNMGESIQHAYIGLLR
jgi:hypothetical protein